MSFFTNVALYLAVEYELLLKIRLIDVLQSEESAERFRLVFCLSCVPKSFIK